MNREEERQIEVWWAVANCFSWYETKCSPSSWRCFRYRAGWYLLIRFAILLACLLVVSGKLNAWNVLIGALGVIFLVDIIVANTSNAFVTKNPINSLRSFLLTFFAFSHVIVIYATFYRLLEHQFDGGLCASQALYFSAVTIATVGYGDFAPQKSASSAQMVVILEVLTGLFLVSVILTKVVGLQEKSAASSERSKE